MKQFILPEHWQVTDHDQAAVKAIATAVPCSLPFSRLLINRGHNDPQMARQFLRASESQIHSPQLLKGMDAAIALLKQASQNRLPILVYGDFDTDGIMSTIIMRTALQLSGAKVETYIPDRVSEGHGMRPEVVRRQFAEQGIRLIVTVDQGIASHEAVNCAKELGVKVLITDHHLSLGERPGADAIIDPHQPDCGYPNKALCGSGLAWQVARAWLEVCGINQNLRESYLQSLLKLVAIGSIADVVPLDGENRALVRLGLQALKQHQNLGLKSLFARAGIPEGWPPSSHAIAFRVAPRINAANRMAHAKLVMDLLDSQEPEVVEEIVNTLDELNNNRRAAEQKAVEDICNRLQDRPPQHAEVVLGWGWPAGVNGIIASRLVDRFGVPVFVLQEDEEGIARGSGRSVPGFDLGEALQKMEKLLLQYGGHAQAAGVALAAGNVGAFRECLRFLAEQRQISAATTAVADAWVDFEELTPELNRDLEQLEPTGQGNPCARFVTSGTVQTLDSKMVLEHEGRLLELRSNGTNLAQWEGREAVCIVELLPRGRNSFLGIVRDIAPALVERKRRRPAPAAAIA